MKKIFASKNHKYYRLLCIIAIALMTGHRVEGQQPKPTLPVSFPANFHTRPGKPDDWGRWKTAEFLNNWGLNAINADAAYASGINGQGVKLGIIDGGTWRGHPEFSGEGKLISLRLSGQRTLKGLPVTGEGPGDDFNFEGGIPTFTVNETSLALQTHGTHVGAVIAGNRDDYGMHGVAPQATLVVAAIETTYAKRDKDSTDNPDPAIYNQAVEGMVKAGVIAINYSHSVPPGENTVGQYLNDRVDGTHRNMDAVETVIEKDIVNVFAAGNDYHSMPNAVAFLPYFRPYPSFETHLLVVTAENSDGSLADYSNLCGKTKWWCVSAPGSNINSAMFDQNNVSDADLGVLIKKNLDNDEELKKIYQWNDEEYQNLKTYFLFEDFQKDETQYPDIKVPAFMTALSKYAETKLVANYSKQSGTSVAAPHATGLLGLIKQRFPYLNNGQGNMVLMGTATDKDEPGIDEKRGWGLINVEKAMKGPGRLLHSLILDDIEGSEPVSDIWRNTIDDGPMEQRALDDREEQNNWNNFKHKQGWTLNLPVDAITEDKIFYNIHREREAVRHMRDLQGYSAHLVLNRWGEITLTEDNCHHGLTFASQKGRWNIDGVQRWSRAVAGVQGTIGGTGTTHGITILSGGMLAPGHSATGTSIGTLQSDDEGIQMLSGSSVHIEVAADNRSDRLETTGQMDIEDSSFLILTEENKNTPLESAAIQRLLGNHYVILKADKGVQGRFNESKLPHLLFVKIGVEYQPDTVAVVFRRNALSFADIGNTTNQKSTAASIEHLGNVCLPDEHYQQERFDDSTMIPVVGSEKTTSQIIDEPVSGDMLAGGQSKEHHLADDSSGQVLLDGSTIAPMVSSQKTGLQNGDEKQPSGKKYTKRAVTNLAKSSHPLYKAMLFASSPQVAQQFSDQLSGELHASVKSALIEASHFSRDAINTRLRVAFIFPDSAAWPVMMYDKKAPVLMADDSEAFTTWGQIYDAWGSSDGKGVAAKLQNTTQGFILGGDTVVREIWRTGLAAGYSRSSLKVPKHVSSANVDNYTVAAYAGRQQGAVGLHFGGVHTWHTLDTSRYISSLLSATPTASYNAQTVQVFGEAGYGLDYSPVTFEPFAGLAYVNLHTEGVNESSIAGLKGRKSTTEVVFTTTGLRAASVFEAGSMQGTVHGMLGWQHAFSDTASSVSHGFVGGHNTFSVSGTPVTRDAAVIETGLYLNMSKNTRLSLYYNGQLANGAREHGVTTHIQMTF